MATRKKPPAASAPSTRVSVPLLLLLAFALGAGTSWLVTRAAHRASPQPVIQNFIPPGVSASPNVAPLASPVAAPPPDVSKLPPAEAARTLANWNYDRQNWSHAIEHYEQAMTLGADNPDVRTDLGNCYRFLGQPEKALEQYQLAQKQDPQHENSLFNQISLFAQLLHDQDRATSAAREFIARFPQSPQAETARQQLQTNPGLPQRN
ncbi:MAG: tetratricopeptide repeat protein [Chthoniobacterales bacterium]|nr:tetratricopeptide repeat protein [Chthoniobacterales bacterium]